jgi:dihydroorotate dehydrogenase electron transfer subunit
MDGQRAVARDRLTLLFGAAHEGFLYDLDALRALGAGVHVATDDGSAGFHGNVLGLLAELQRSGTLPERVRICACGPEPMLHAVEKLACERGLEAYLSFETLMGCGVGICNGCPLETKADGPLGAWPNAKCCVEGPVFSVEAVRVG